MIKIKFKIFNISFPKNGTSSFITIMRKLGFKTKHWDKNICDLFIKKKYKKIFEIVNKNDVFADFPWPMLYKELQFNFNAKFILFERPEEEWINSCLKYFRSEKKELFGGNKIRKIVFSSEFPKGNEKEYINSYKKHNFYAKNFFKKNKNFLSIKLGDSKDWEDACKFLRISQVKFPKLNES